MISKLLQIAAGEVGVTEGTSPNSGVRVEQYQAATHTKVGSPWCGSFAAWCFIQAGYEFKKPWDMAGSYNWFPEDRLIKASDVRPGDVFGLYYSKLKRIGHVGIVVKVDANYIYTIEGNTNGAGSREGDGVFRKTRKKKSVYAFARWT